VDSPLLGETLGELLDVPPPPPQLMIKNVIKINRQEIIDEIS
jgi:hypothetical protein